jgi:hypothetical protein
MSVTEKKKPTYANNHVMFVSSILIDEETSQPQENFVGIPLNENSPFVEIIFDPKKQILGIVSKIKKESFHWVTRVDADGMPIATKNKSLAASQPFQQQRVQLETYHEYYIRNKESIVHFIEIHMCNDFDYKKYLTK